MILIFDLLKQLVLFIKFHFTRISKWVAILFKKNKKLKKISFDYYKNWHSDSSYLIVDFKFKNAIYFRVGETKSFDFSIPLILNLQSLETNNIMVEVFGFLQKQIFVIELNKEIQLNTKSFKTKFENLSPVAIPEQKTKVKIPNFWFALNKPKIKIQSVSVNASNITIKSNKFKIQEYI
jgi:hypothetical protein